MSEPGPELRTERLRLRQWRPADREPFAALNADPVVMEFFPSTLTREQSDGLADRIDALFDARGYGLWAVEVPGVVPFAGFIGLAVPRFTSHFTPCVEIGWRLARACWGQGYATEGARAVLHVAFDRLQLAEVVALTAVGNVRSRRVMDKLWMTRRPEDDFDHPLIAASNPVCRQVLYRLSSERPTTPG